MLALELEEEIRLRMVEKARFMWGGGRAGGPLWLCLPLFRIRDSRTLLRCAPAGVARLIAAYPDHLEKVDGNWLVWRDGTRMALDDGAGTKSFADWLERPDIEDMFQAPYPAGVGAHRSGAGERSRSRTQRGVLRQDVRRLPQG